MLNLSKSAKRHELRTRFGRGECGRQDGLKHFGKTAEIVFFPRENHNLTRTGEPKHLVESLNWQLYWFDRYLQNRQTVGTDRR